MSRPRTSYPLRPCACCDKPMLPKVYWDSKRQRGRIQTKSEYNRRKYCDIKCRSKWLNAKAALRPPKASKPQYQIKSDAEIDLAYGERRYG